jgi:hypothetical protein
VTFQASALGASWMGIRSRATGHVTLSYALIQGAWRGYLKESLASETLNSVRFERMSNSFQPTVRESESAIYATAGSLMVDGLQVRGYRTAIRTSAGLSIAQAILVPDTEFHGGAAVRVLPGGSLNLETSTVHGWYSSIVVGRENSEPGAFARIRNSLLTANEGAAVHVASGSAVDLSHVGFFGNGIDVYGASPGPGAIFADPLYVDPNGGNFNLLPGSPAIGAGDLGGTLGACTGDC